MSAIQIATIAMSISSIVISCMSVYWSVRARRARQEIARIRAEREKR